MTFQLQRYLDFSTIVGLDDFSVITVLVSIIALFCISYFATHVHNLFFVTVKSRDIEIRWHEIAHKLTLSDSTASLHSVSVMSAILSITRRPMSRLQFEVNGNRSQSHSTQESSTSSISLQAGDVIFVSELQMDAVASDDFAIKKRQWQQSCVASKKAAEEALAAQAEAENLTKEVMGEPPSGDVRKLDTLLHLLNGMAGSPCLFYDTRTAPSPFQSKLRCMDMMTTDDNTDDDAGDEKTQSPTPTPKLVVTLNSVFGDTDNHNHNQDKDADTAILMEMCECVRKGQPHPIVDSYREKLSCAHGVRISQINITAIRAGSVHIEYTPRGLSEIEVAQLCKPEAVAELDKKMHDVFDDNYRELEMQSLLLSDRDACDLAMFDERGNQTFSSGEQYAVGPPGNTQTYTQPQGWVRFGLRVLDGNGNIPAQDDRWLAPFQDDGNWYRAYCGTDAADVMSAIRSMTLPMSSGSDGDGVHCSPNPRFTAETHAGQQEIDSQRGRRAFQFMFQVAVNPRAVRFVSDDVWVIDSPADIRVYGILVREKLIRSGSDDASVAAELDASSYSTSDALLADASMLNPSNISLAGPAANARAFFTGLMIGDKFVENHFSVVYQVDKCSEYVGVGSYPDNRQAFPKAVRSTFDGIAVDADTRVVIYEFPNFGGRVLLDRVGPAIICNCIWKDNAFYNHVLTDDFTAALQAIYPQHVREWSISNMHAWSTGSVKIVAGN